MKQDITSWAQWLPLVFVVPTLYLFEHSSFDVVFADFWYQLEGGYWALRKNWFTYDIMHRDGGAYAYVRNLQFTTAINAGHCFPAAHSAGGFGLLAVYFAFGPFVKSPGNNHELQGAIL